MRRDGGGAHHGGVDGAAVEALGLGLVAEEELPGVGLAEQAIKADGDAQAAILGAGDLDIADELIVEEVVRSAVRGDGLIQGSGEETGLQAGESSSSRRTTANLEAVKPCLRAFWAERVLPSGVMGPVERAALVRLAARRRADGALVDLVGSAVLDIRLRFTTAAGGGRR